MLSAGTVWLFAAGLRALPRVGNSTDSGVIAVYCATWILLALVAIRGTQRIGALSDRLGDARAAARQSDRVAQLIGALAAARTPAAAAEASLMEPLHALHATAGLLVLVTRDGRFDEVLRAVGYGSGEHAIRAALASSRQTPAADSVGRGAPVFVETPAARDRDYPGPESSFGATAAIPLLVGSRVVAVVELDFRQAREFPPADREYLMTLGLRAAQALDRTWQLDAALTARADAEALRLRADAELEERQKIELALRASETRYRALAARTSRMHWFAAALSEAATLQAVGRAVLEHGRNVLGAAGGEVALLAADGSAFETLHADAPAGGPRPGSRYSLEDRQCAADAIATRNPVLIGSFDDWQDRYPRSAALAADGGYVSSATLPLVIDNQPAGVVSFHFTAPVNFDEDYRGVLLAVAQHCAQAIDRANLYEAAQQARAEAERANQQKDEFVSILSHDLRAPLNAILGWTSFLQQGMLDRAGAERALQSIADNATRQQHLVEELLDFSRIRSGRLTLSLEPVDLRELLRGIVEANIPVAASRGLRVDLAPIPPVEVIGDRRRLEQVFFNLVGNALKFTPEGGRIGIDVKTAQGDDQTVEARVSDTGAGIAPDVLPHVFDPFRQGDDQSANRYGGVGLGLSIARELVEAHKGHIRAESEGPGRGATFIVSLPATVACS